jgi:hypothetical protein
LAIKLEEKEIMPPKHYKNFTVREEAYNMLKEDYESMSKEWLVRHGISSLSGYVMFRLNELAEERARAKETLKRKTQ